MASSGASEAECRRVEEALRKERDRGRSIVTSNAGKRLKSYLKSLCQRAKELGASAAVAIPVTDVVVDERAMLKCVVPLLGARPSMEAMGIDVVATAERAGTQLYFARNETRSWVGLILVD